MKTGYRPMKGAAMSSASAASQVHRAFLAGSEASILLMSTVAGVADAASTRGCGTLMTAPRLRNTAAGPPGHLQDRLTLNSSLFPPEQPGRPEHQHDRHDHEHDD